MTYFRIAPILLVLFLFPAVASSQDYTKEAASIIKKNADKDDFTGTVLIAEKGEIKYLESFGKANYEEEVALTTDTRYGIASITKMITAIITLQLVQEEKLQLSNSLDELLPELEIPDAGEITVHHLLLHISGLPNEKNSAYRKPLEPEAFISEVLQNPGGKRERGSYNYSNIDYVLLGLIIEQKTGESWEQNVRKRILEPLNMNDTGFLKIKNLPENYAYTYSVNWLGKFKRDPEFYIENFWASGNMYSTARDLLKLDQAMYGDKLLNDEMKDKMYTSYPEYNYTGYSVWTYRYPFIDSQPKIMERRGGILGSNSVLIRMLDQNKTIIILSNNDEFNPDSFGDEDNLREALIRVVAE